MTDHEDISGPDLGAPPTRGIGDIAHAGVRAFLSVCVAGPAAELFSLIIAPPLERRRDEWLTTLAAAVTKLVAQRGISTAALRDNPEFIDAVLKASQAALRTSSEHKRDALRNAVLNAGLPVAPDATRQALFLRYVDELTEQHLRLLAFNDGPEAWGAKNQRPVRGAGSVLDVIEQAFPALKGQADLTCQLLKDLADRGLVQSFGATTWATPPGSLAPRTTSMGSSLLDFVRSPL